MGRSRCVCGRRLAGRRGWQCADLALLKAVSMRSEILHVDLRAVNVDDFVAQSDVPSIFGMKNQRSRPFLTTKKVHTGELDVCVFALGDVIACGLWGSQSRLLTLPGEHLVRGSKPAACSVERGSFFDRFSNFCLHTAAVYVLPVNIQFQEGLLYRYTLAIPGRSLCSHKTRSRLSLPRGCLLERTYFYICLLA